MRERQQRQGQFQNFTDLVLTEIQRDFTYVSQLKYIEDQSQDRSKIGGDEYGFLPLEFKTTKEH